MRTLFVLLGILLVWFAPAALGDDVSPGAGGVSEITIISVDIGHVSYGNRTIHIFENSRNSLQNSNRYSKWQFNIEPLFSTLPDSDGKILHYITSLEPEYRWSSGRWVSYARYRVVIPLILSNDETKKKCLEVIENIYPEAKDQVNEKNIDVLPIVRIVLSSNDLTTGMFHNTVVMQDTEQGFFSSPSKIYLTFDVTEKRPGESTQQLERFINFLPYLDISANVSFSVKSASINLVGVDADKIKETSLYKKLNGSGGALYVSRRDLQNLALQAAAQLQVTQIIEDKSNFSQALIDRLLDTVQDEVHADETNFSAQMWQQTYNGDDLKPSVIQNYVNKIWNYDSEKKQWNTNVSASGGGSFLDIIKANASGSYSDSGLQEYLKQNSIDTEITGQIIIVKSIDLVQVNFANFFASGKIGTETRNIQGTETKTNLQTVIYGEPVDPATGQEVPYPTVGQEGNKKLATQ